MATFKYLFTSFILFSFIIPPSVYAGKCETLRDLAKLIVRDINNVDQVHRMCKINSGVTGGLVGAPGGAVGGSVAGGLAGCAVGAFAGAGGGGTVSLAALNPASMLLTVPLGAVGGCMVGSIPGRVAGGLAGLIAGGVSGPQVYRLCTLMKSDYERCVKENPNLFKQ